MNVKIQIPLRKNRQCDTFEKILHQKQPLLNTGNTEVTTGYYFLMLSVNASMSSLSHFKLTVHDLNFLSLSEIKALFSWKLWHDLVEDFLTREVLKVCASTAQYSASTAVEDKRQRSVEFLNKNSVQNLV